MQSLSAFFEDNKLLAIAAALAALIVLVIVVFVLYRLLFGRRLRAAANGRSRQPRLGIVDAYDLDRQRQLVLVRRDNVEHLIMIGGPTDVVIESSIIRVQAAPGTREKDGGPMMGGAAGPALAPAAPQPAIPPSAPLATGGRTEPSIGSPATVRTEPPLGIAMISPAIDRPPADRGASAPIAVPDPAAPAGPSQQQPTRMPPRPAPVPPRAAPSGAMTPPPTGAAPPSGSVTPTDRPAPARTPLPPRPPITRPPLPPRPNLASTLPPRPTRPLPSRPDTPRPDTTRPGAPIDEVPGTTPPTPGVQPSIGLEDADLRATREPDRAPPTPDAVPTPPKTIETLESLEEEMAKLLGRPAPRRDG